MNSSDWPDIRLHEDVSLFHEAVSFTAARTAFPAGLIEKDYFATLLLARLASVPGDHVFKGGTCLAKVYGEFYRLSEDLDFAIPMLPTASRAERSKKVARLKEAIVHLAGNMDCFDRVVPLRGANDSTQYIGSVGYTSRFDGQPQTLQVEVSLRESLLRPSTMRMAKTLLLDPVTDQPAVGPLPVRCMDAVEGLAEKFRAAMTRREVAIRDFYDIAQVVKGLGVHASDDELLELVKLKLGVPGNESVQIGPERLAQLRGQLVGRLKPVLRPWDFEAFDLDGAFAIVAQVAQAFLAEE